jgi:hypothetical protein
LSYEQAQDEEDELRMPPYCFSERDQWRDRMERMAELAGQENVNSLL